MGRARSLTASEANIQQSIMNWSVWQKKNGIGMFRINVIGVPVGEGKFRPSPNVGMADIYMSVQTEGISIGVWVEVKKHGGKQSKTQKEFEKKVKEQNGWYFIVKSIEDVEEVIRIILDDTWKKIKKFTKQFKEYETG